jgi:hypothetical protein
MGHLHAYFHMFHTSNERLICYLCQEAPRHRGVSWWNRQCGDISPWNWESASENPGLCQSSYPNFWWVNECLNPPNVIHVHTWLVVYLPLWKIWKSMVRIIPYIVENKKCSKPPTSTCSCMLVHVSPHLLHPSCEWLMKDLRVILRVTTCAAHGENMWNMFCFFVYILPSGKLT